MSKKVVFKFQGTGVTYSTECLANLEVPTVRCSAVDMFRRGLDSTVLVDTKEDTEVNVVMPDSAKDAQTLQTMCMMGKTFCEMCKYNAVKSKQK